MYHEAHLKKKDTPERVNDKRKSNDRSMAILALTIQKMAFSRAAIRSSAAAEQVEKRLIFRAIRLGKWKESTPMSGRRCGARRATDCLREFHAFPYPPPLVVHHHPYVHPYHLE